MSVKKWNCTEKCKPISEREIDSILSLKADFEGPVEAVREALDLCDEGCPYGHHDKQVYSCPVPRKGHPIVCHNGMECTSKMRILRAVSTYFPLLRRLTALVYTALRSHNLISAIDGALSVGDFHKLLEVTDCHTFDSLIIINVDSRYEQCVAAPTDLRQPDLEDKLLSTHIGLISKFEKEIYDFPEHVCCSCERLHQRKALIVGFLQI